VSEDASPKGARACGCCAGTGQIHRACDCCAGTGKEVAEPAADFVSAIGGTEFHLREALLDMASGWRYIRQHHGDLPGVGWERCEASATAALALQPSDAAKAVQVLVAESRAAIAALVAALAPFEGGADGC